MTKAIILSGGWGTRLRPLTCTIPKTLIPILNKPVIERQILLLKATGVKEIVLAVSVMADVVQNYFKDGEKWGINIKYTNEKHPMGTAGALKLAELHLKDENFFMLNGDVILNFDFKNMLEFHKNKGGIGTIASKIVNDPSRYGVLITDSDTNQLYHFLEKDEYLTPDRDNIPMPVNAGVYLLEPEIFSYIEANKKTSIEREVFPKVLEGQRLYHFPITGVWRDIGKPYDLLLGNIILMKDILANLSEKRKNLVDDSVNIDPTSLIYPPCTIGKNVVIRNNCKIGPNAIIGDNVYIDKNTKIKEALIYNDTYLSKNIKIEASIVSDNCFLEDNVELKGIDEDLIILASYVKVLKKVQLIANKDQAIHICHHEEIKESIIR